ncbi:hypothetical protein [Vulcanococcus limneticus]|uniref:hypothetical protein n=1 Tax=Vulcanococcus limneticus TaxID=2170428 RepID=UPI00398BC5F0
MPAVSFSDAAAAVGHSSRSTLYRLRDEQRLDAYLRPGGRGGAQLLELTPPGLPTLRQHLERILRPQISASKGRKGSASSSGRVDRRWGAVAGSVSDAMAAVGGLSLTAEEAAAIAEALPGAICDAFGWAGAAKLRELLAAAVEALPAAGGEPLGATPAAADGDPLAFFREFGRIEPNPEPLKGEAYWQEVAAWLNALEGRGPAADPRADGSEPPEPYGWAEVAGIANHVADIGPAVDAGARFDLARWDSSSLREFWIPDTCDGCAVSAEMLQRLLALGRVPEELREPALKALAPTKSHRI